jgi:LCP family protein required for cell wall assembly
LDLRKSANGQSGPSIIPNWLTYLLSGSFIVSGIVVSIFVFLTAEAVLAQPLNPLTQGLGQLSATVEPIIVEQTATPLNGGAAPGIIIGSEDGLPTFDAQQAIQIQQTQDSIRGTVEASGRITVLVMGIDRRPGEDFQSLTDTMMVVSLNPLDNTASIMNIPRDFFAEIPGVNGRRRINTAFNIGYGRGVRGPAGGAALAIETVEQNLAIVIDHYVLIDFTAFIHSVDAIGGVDIDVPKDIYDASYPTMNFGYEVFAVSAGANHFDGQTALKYARTRHGDTDFGRSMRQQQVIMAVRDKVFDLGVEELLFQFPILYAEVSEGVRTDLALSDMYSLAMIARSMPRENIKTVVLDYNHFYNYTTPDGQQVLILQNAAIGPVIADLFYD